ncbi:MAG: transposase [Paracoccaceae bacterium]|jgi:transposase
MKSKRYTDEFKKEAVKQVTERGYSVADVVQRFDTTTHSLYPWLKTFGEPNPQASHKIDLSAKNARFKSELQRMTEERDILKRAEKYFANNPERSTPLSTIINLSSLSKLCVVSLRSIAVGIMLV